MNRKLFAAAACVCAVFLAIIGCATSEPEIVEVERTVTVEKPVEVIDTRMPLTISLLDRISARFTDISADVQKFQFILFGRITLEREYTEQNDGLERGGRLKIEDVYIRDVLTIPDQTAGQALRFEETAEELLLYVCFERDRDDTMIFASNKRDPNGVFYLKVASDGIPLYGEEKGVMEYGGQRYKVKYSGDREPYLLIRLSQENVDRMNERVLEGRMVDEAQTESREGEAAVNSAFTF